MDARAASLDDGFPYVDWDYWRSVNPDMVAWVTIPGTGIDHPILQAREADPDFYLTHDIYMQPNPMGVPYLDAGCEAGIESRNKLVYGHHWSDGRVFADISLMSDRVYAEDHADVLLQTPDRRSRMTLRLVEVTSGSADSAVVRFEDDGGFRAWYLERYASSTVRLADEPASDGFPEEVLTLCTCSYATADGRTLAISSE